MQDCCHPTDSNEARSPASAKKYDDGKFTTMRGPWCRQRPSGHRHRKNQLPAPRKATFDAALKRSALVQDKDLNKIRLKGRGDSSVLTTNGVRIAVRQSLHRLVERRLGQRPVTLMMSRF